jgi:hypothetical protein
MMPAYELDPLSDSRWPEFVEHHTDASVFHTRGWLKALRNTYHYQPIVLTTTAPGRPLTAGLVFCKIQSWLTGSRLVSLPFSDHCQPLINQCGELRELLSFFGEKQNRKWKYVELRPKAVGDWQLEAPGFAQSEAFCFHALDLRPSLDDIYRGFHKSCIQRKVQRAAKEALSLERGRSEDLLRKFYGLMLLTRRRHQLPPQPFRWFQQLADSLGEKLLVRVALKDGQPIASILTISHHRTVVYKYGCSDSKHHSVGGMPFLFWQAIQDAKAAGAEEFDFGRSELDNEGLIAFKDHWGGSRRTLNYYKYPGTKSKSLAKSWRAQATRKGFSILPDFCLTAAGKLLYKHIG